MPSPAARLPSDPPAAAWVAVDWGTSNVRAWAIDTDGSVLAEARSTAGMARLAPAGFEPALLELIEPWLRDGVLTPVVACGMVGARQGWIEAPYAAVPCPPVGGSRATGAPVRDPRLHVFILPGLRQDTPPDVMRGEETQIAGFLATEPGFHGIVCLPGTHSKWARISGGEVTGFTTCMTGEIFALLGEHSVLRHTIDGSSDWDDAAFAAGVTQALTAPAAVPARLFGIRAEGLTLGTAAGTARARLSGLLIGAELAALRPLWQDHEVVLIGDPSLSRAYATALARGGATSRSVPGADMTLAGLAAARRALP